MEPITWIRIQELLERSRRRLADACRYCECWRPEPRDCHCHRHLCGACGKLIRRDAE